MLNNKENNYGRSVTKYDVYLLWLSKSHFQCNLDGKAFVADWYWLHRIWIVWLITMKVPVREDTRGWKGVQEYVFLLRLWLCNPTPTRGCQPDSSPLVTWAMPMANKRLARRGIIVYKEAGCSWPAYPIHTFKQLFLSFISPLPMFHQ